MKKTLVGMVASVVMLGSGLALAEDYPGKEKEKAGMQQPSGQEGYGGAGQQGQQPERMQQPPGQMGQMPQQGQMMGQKELSGTVVKSGMRELHVLTDAGIIPLKVTRDTQFQDPNVKRARDIKEGQQVRASFEVQKQDNVAKSISLAPGMGGAGMQENMKEKEKKEGTGGGGLFEEELEVEPLETE